MTAGTLTLVLWNIAWQRRASNAGRAIRHLIDEHRPDVVCLTESYDDFLEDGGYSVSSQPDYGYPIVGGRRKVLLWSRQPWSAVDRLGSPELPLGRYVAAATPTPLGPIEFVGVCIPWPAAHVSTGRRDRRRWQDHIDYLKALAPLLRGSATPRVVLGDFNQMIPRRGAPETVFAAMNDALAGLEVATAGNIPPIGKPSVDHVAYAGPFRALEVASISNLSPQGRPLSDHFGLVLRLAARTGAARPQGGSC